MSVIQGTASNDVLLGAAGNDTIFGAAGDDTLYGMAGDDQLIGGDGNDALNGGDGNDFLWGEAGNDTLDGGAGDNYLDALSGNNSISAGDGNNSVFSQGGGNNTVVLGGGTNSIVMGPGTNTVTAGNGNNSFFGGSGVNTVVLGNGNNYVSTGSGANTITLGNGKNTFLGGAGTDTVVAGNGDNYLSTGDGNDAITVGAGNNTITTGAGDDTITLGAGNNTVTGGAGLDTVVLAGKSSDYNLAMDGPAMVLTNLATGRKDVLSSVERIQYADTSVLPAPAIDFANASTAQKQAWVNANAGVLLPQGGLRLTGPVISYAFEATDFLAGSAAHLPVGQAYVYKPIGELLKTFYREVFAYLGSFLGVSFQEAASGSGAQIRIGSHNMTEGGYATQPDATGHASVLLNSDYQPSALGDYVFLAAVHELGHALGLEHTEAYNEGSSLPNLDGALDSMAMSAMSYNLYSVNDSYISSYMPLDVAGLKALYGAKADFTSNIYKIVYDASLSHDKTAGLVNDYGGQVATIYAYSPSMIVDNGGIDTLDLSACTTGMTVDLAKGAIYGSATATQQVYASSTFIALDASGPLLTIDPFSVIERVQGSAGADTLIGGAAGETLTGGAGNDTLDGGAGIDTAVFNGTRASYTLTLGAGTAAASTVKDNRTTAGNDGTDKLSNVERLMFSDASLALDLAATQAAGKAAMMMGATLGPAFPLDKAWAGTFIRYFDNGASMLDGATLLVSSGIMRDIAGGADNTAFVNLVYNNVYGQLPSATVLASLVAPLNAGTLSQAQWMADVAASASNQTHVGLVGLAGTGLQYT